MHATVSRVSLFGTATFIAERSAFFSSMFSPAVFGHDAALFIAEFIKKQRPRLSVYSEEKQLLCAGNLDALTILAGRVKYILAHLELLECYGIQIGIMTEHQLFREHALMYMSIVHAEMEALEYFEVT